MTRLGQGSRVLIGTCAYIFVAVSVVGGAFSATMVLTSADNVSAGARRPAGKIGPGYARMLPPDFGKPEKVAYSTPYHARVAPRGSRTRQPAPAMIAVLTRPPATPMVIARAAPSADSRPDIHRAF
jgi:hypothetical protein